MALKILHLIDSGGLYGAENMLLDLVREQIKSGLRPLILSVGTPDIVEKPFESEARARGLPIEILRMRAGLNIRKGYQIVSYAKKKKYNILHSHGYKFNILIGMIPRFLRGIPIVSTLHGYTQAKGLSLIRVYQYLERLLLKRIDGVIFVCDKIKESPILLGFKTKNSVTIQNGIDVAIALKSSSEGAAFLKEAIPFKHDNSLVIGAIGRLSCEKGFDILIDVFSKIVAEYPDVYLIIIGEGELRPELEKQVQVAGLLDRVKLPGFIQHAYKIMAELDGVVIPSLTEGLPITLLEACVLKKRIVASDVGGIKETLLGYTDSKVVPPGDRDSLFWAIKNLIINGAGEEVDAHGWPIEKFNAELMSKRYSNFYDEVINS